MATDPQSVWFTDMKWRDMGFAKKFIWMGKFVIALISFGFIFPHVMD